jgi:MoaA/NifB/PqqE/SkfB family radical SAM enzyme
LGNTPLPDPLVFARAFDQIYENFESFEMSLLGGEPTVYKGLDWALDKLIKDSNKKISIDTNGSREIYWWQKYGEVFSSVTISYHQQFLQVEHLFFVLETLKQKNVLTHIKLPITPKYWDDIIRVKDMLQVKGYDPEIQLLYKNFTKGNNQYYEYGESQLNFYYNNKNIDDSQIENQIEYKRIHKLNEYHGHMCWSGIDQFVIDKFGNVYRGWCNQGGILGNIYKGEIVWPQDPIMCQKQLCTNGFDLLARKSVNSWGKL